MWSRDEGMLSPSRGCLKLNDAQRVAQAAERWPPERLRLKRFVTLEMGGRRLAGRCVVWRVGRSNRPNGAARYLLRDTSVA